MQPLTLRRGQHDSSVLFVCDRFVRNLCNCVLSVCYLFVVCLFVCCIFWLVLISNLVEAAGATTGHGGCLLLPGAGLGVTVRGVLSCTIRRRRHSGTTRLWRG